MVSMLHRIVRLAKKDEKGHEEIPLDQEDLDLLVEIRVAYEKHLREKQQEERNDKESTPKREILFASQRRIIRALEEAEEGKKSGPPARWEEFLDAKYDGGKKRVPNTNKKTRDSFSEVRVTTLMKTDKAFMKQIMEEYRRWLKEDPKDGETPKSSSKPVFGATYPEEYDIDEVSGKAEALLKSMGLEPRDIVDLSGLGGADDPLVVMEINMKNGKVVFEGTGQKAGKVKSLYREIDFEKKTMKMEKLELTPNAPKGTGTKILASQIDKARELGLRTLTCEAFRDDPHYVGYKVWGRLGYDGVIPVEKTGLPPKYQKALEKAGHKQPYRIQQLYALGEDAIEWWDEHGDSFEAEFDLADDSLSLKLFKAYVEKKGGYSKLIAAA